MSKFILVAISLFASLFLYANTEEHEGATENHGQSDEQFDPGPAIMHHIADAHEWELFEYTDKHTGEEIQVSVPLPVILVCNGHLDIFMSSEFKKNNGVVKRGDRTYLLHHGTIYLADNGALVSDGETIMNKKPLDLSMTKNVVAMLVSAIIILLIFIPMARMYGGESKVPRGVQAFFEPLVLFIVEDVAKPNIGEEKYKKYLPYLLTVFFFIWINNLMGLIPIIPGGANVMGNIAVTFTLAMFSMILINFNAKKHYWKEIFMPEIPLWLYPIMVPVEIVGVISKPFALMIRLFANIMGGHIIALSLIMLIFIFKSLWIAPVSIGFVLFMDVIELLVAILQAYIFTLLSAIFIGMAVQDHH